MRLRISGPSVYYINDPGADLTDTVPGCLFLRTNSSIWSRTVRKIADNNMNFNYILDAWYIVNVSVSFAGRHNAVASPGRVRQLTGRIGRTTGTA